MHEVDRRHTAPVSSAALPVGEYARQGARHGHDGMQRAHAKPKAGESEVSSANTVLYQSVKVAWQTAWSTRMAAAAGGGSGAQSVVGE